jgi:hypothetical protein
MKAPAGEAAKRRPKQKTRRAAGLVGGHLARLTMTWAVDAAVMVVIMLAVVFLRVNPAALHFLCLMQAGALTARHDAVRFGAVFHVIDMLLTTVEAIGFALGQAARGDALIDTLLLVGLALIDARRVGLGKSERRQDEGKSGDSLDDFHDFLLRFRANSLNAIRK